MARTRKPRIGLEVQLRIIQLRASNAKRPSSIRQILHYLSEEGVEVSQGYVQKVVKEWEGREDRWLEVPFEWRRLELARVPWEASRWLLDCHLYYEMMSSQAREGMENRGGVPIMDAIWLDPFTNRWACWSWRVHQAAPSLQPYFVLLVARIYAAIEQLEALGWDVPTTEFGWLDAVLRHRGDFHGMELDPPLPTEERIREAYFRFLKLGGTFKAVGPYESLKWVYYWMYSWWQNYRDEGEPYCDDQSDAELQSVQSKTSSY